MGERFERDGEGEEYKHGFRGTKDESKKKELQRKEREKSEQYPEREREDEIRS